MTRRPLGRPTNADSAATRRAILAAAAAELAHGGYEGLSLEAVANRVGITRGAIYKYFGSKRELARSAVRDSTTAFGDAVDEEVLPAGGIRDQLRALIRVAAHNVFDYPDRSISYYQLGRLAGEDDEIAAVFRERSMLVRTVIIRLVADAVERGEITRGADTSAVVEAVAGLVWIVGAGAAAAPNDEVREQILGALELILDRPAWIAEPAQPGSTS